MCETRASRSSMSASTSAQLRASSKTAPGEIRGLPARGERHETSRQERFVRRVTEVKTEIGVATALVGMVPIELAPFAA